MKVILKSEALIKCVIEREEIDLIVRLAEAQAASQFVSSQEKEKCKKLISQIGYEKKPSKVTLPKSSK